MDTWSCIWIHGLTFTFLFLYACVIVYINICVANRGLPGSIILYRVNKTSGLFWLSQAFTKLHALRLQGEYLLFEENVSRVNM